MSTQTERRMLRIELGEKMKAWLKMTDEELFAETKKVWPNISQANREECLKFLVLEHVDKMVK